MGRVLREKQKGLRMKNTEFLKKHVIVGALPEEKLVKQMASGQSVRMVDLARAMGIDVVEQ